MALYLTHLTLNGEPIGVHNYLGESYYFPGMEQHARKFGEGPEDTWPDFVEEKTRSFNQRFHWGSVDDERTDLEDILMDLRSKYRDG